jgi:hypothetical protein
LAGRKRKLIVQPHASAAKWSGRHSGSSSQRIARLTTGKPCLGLLFPDGHQAID